MTQIGINKIALYGKPLQMLPKVNLTSPQKIRVKEIVNLWAEKETNNDGLPKPRTK